jgi:hypothetical protein
MLWRERFAVLARFADRMAERASFRDTVPYPQIIRDVVV